jgi:hypothetical protein
LKFAQVVTISGQDKKKTLQKLTVLEDLQKELQHKLPQKLKKLLNGFNLNKSQEFSNLAFFNKQYIIFVCNLI